VSDITIPNRPLGPHLGLTDAIRLGRWHETQIVGNGFDSGRPLGSDADGCLLILAEHEAPEVGVAIIDDVERSARPRLILDAADDTLTQVTIIGGAGQRGSSRRCFLSSIRNHRFVRDPLEETIDQAHLTL
jgi:hypothetical protein